MNKKLVTEGSFKDFLGKLAYSLGNKMGKQLFKDKEIQKKLKKVQQSLDDLGMTIEQRKKFLGLED